MERELRPLRKKTNKEIKGVILKSVKTTDRIRIPNTDLDLINEHYDGDLTIKDTYVLNNMLQLINARHIKKRLSMYKIPTKIITEFDNNLTVKGLIEEVQKINSFPISDEYDVVRIVNRMVSILSISTYVFNNEGSEIMSTYLAVNENQGWMRLFYEVIKPSRLLEDEVIYEFLNNGSIIRLVVDGEKLITDKPLKIKTHRTGLRKESLVTEDKDLSYLVDTIRSVVNNDSLCKKDEYVYTNPNKPGETYVRDYEAEFFNDKLSALPNVVTIEDNYLGEVIEFEKSRTDIIKSIDSMSEKEFKIALEDNNIKTRTELIEIMTNKYLMEKKEEKEIEKKNKYYRENGIYKRVINKDIADSLEDKN